MKINREVLIKLFPSYGVAPVELAKGAKQAINSGKSQKASAQYEPFLIGNDYEWDENTHSYKKGDQSIYFFAGAELFLWVWQGILVRTLQGAGQLQKWIQGDEKYPEGKANTFMGTYKEMTGQDDSGGGTAVAPPSEMNNEPEDMSRNPNATPDNITFNGNGVRPSSYKEPDVNNTPSDPVDALIAQYKKKMGSKGTLPSDDIIDLYNKAKKLKSNKLMTFIKSIKPLEEGYIKKSTLNEIIRHIVSIVIKESINENEFDGKKFPVHNAKISDSEFKEANKIATQIWGDKLKNIKFHSKSLNGKESFFEVDTNITYHQWLTKDKHGNWFYNNGGVHGEWIPFEGNVSEETGTGAVSPVTAPSLIKQRKVEEMTTTGAVQGYNVPGAFSKKGGSAAGVKGSESLGYTLTPSGKKEMNRQADKLLEEGDEADAVQDMWAGSNDDLNAHGGREISNKSKPNVKKQVSTSLPSKKAGVAKVNGKPIKI